MNCSSYLRDTTKIKFNGGLDAMRYGLSDPRNYILGSFTFLPKYMLICHPRDHFWRRLPGSNEDTDIDHQDRVLFIIHHVVTILKK